MTHWNVIQSQNRSVFSRVNARAKKHCRAVKKMHERQEKERFRRFRQQWADELYLRLRVAMANRYYYIGRLHKVLVERLYQLRVRERMSLGQRLDMAGCVLCGDKIHVSDFAGGNYAVIIVNGEKVIVHRTCPNEKEEANQKEYGYG